MYFLEKLLIRFGKIKPQWQALLLIVVIFLLVFANNLVFQIMESHAHSKIILVNIIVSIGLVLSILTVLYLYFKFVQKSIVHGHHEYDETVLKLTLDNLDTCIYINEIDTGKILFINKKMLKEFGDGDLVGKVCWEVLQDGFEERCEFCPVPKLIESKDEYCIWEEHNTVTKKYYQNTDSLIKWTDGRLVHMQHSVDITQHKLFEMKLEKAILAAQQASKAKSSFLSKMSHEIRTPMNAIIGMTKIAQASDNPDKIEHCLSNISLSSNHLLGIINDILDMSKIEADKLFLEHERFSIEKMLMNVNNIIINKAEEKKQEVRIVIDKNMHQNFVGDALRLSQVLTNLLSNAVKFTPEGGVIKLNVEEISNIDNCSTIRFKISDNGIGISDEQQKRLFTSFEQADESTARKYGGTGLGLAISKSIVEKMNGKIWIESELGSGSTFMFDVKLECSPVQDSPHLGQVNLSELRVLVVDDCEDVRRYFLEVMNKFGISADAAADGEEAINLVDAAIANQKNYGVIFLDWSMPGMDGIETARHLNDKINTNTTIVMISVSEWSEIEGLANSVGIQRFVPKPLFPSSILNAINEVVDTTIKKPDTKSGDTTEVADFSNISLLLVEDVKINANIFIALLKSTNVKIETAENGIIALQKFSADPDKYDVIIMDIQMPEMDGYEATRRIRALDIEKAREIPIIAMTANAFTEDIEMCLSSGMNDHLSKPIDEKKVMEKIAKYTSKSSKEIVLGEQSEAEQPEVSFLPYIDLEEIKKRFGDCMDAYPELLEDFLQSESLSEFVCAINKNDLELAKSAIHKIKGIAGNLSLKKLYTLTCDLEVKIKEQTFESQDSNEFEQVVTDTRKAIEKLLKLAIKV